MRVTHGGGRWGLEGLRIEVGMTSTEAYFFVLQGRSSDGGVGLGQIISDIDLAKINRHAHDRLGPDARCQVFKLHSFESC